MFLGQNTSIILEHCSGKPVSSPLIQECAKGQDMEGYYYNKKYRTCVRHGYKCGYADKEERYFLWESRKECMKSNWTS